MATTNPLAESMTKVTGLDPLSTSTGTSPITYGDELGFRQPEADVITITGDPGTGATTAETWAHELDLAQQEFENLQFEYSQQQDLLAAQQWSQQQALNQAASDLAAQQYGLSAQSAAREAEMQPYTIEAANLANQQAQYEVDKINKEKQFVADYYAQAAIDFEKNKNTYRDPATGKLLYGQENLQPYWAATQHHK